MLLWILGALAALLLLVCLIRVGAQVVWKDGAATVDVKVAGFRIRVYPGKDTDQAEEKETKSKGNGSKKKLPKPSLEEILDAAKTLWPPLKKAVGRVRRGIRIAPLDLNLTLGGQEEPDKTAQWYGHLHTGMWTVMPVLEKGLDVPDPHIHIGMDFTTAQTTAEGELGLTARIGTLLAAGITLGIPALRWFLKYRKNKKQQAPAKQPAA